MPPPMNDNTGKVVPPNGGASQVGQPFNYSTCVDSIQIPRFIYDDPKLLPGARLLWGVIRRLAYKSGKCFARDKVLCAELHVSERQLQRYCRNLVKAGLLRVTEQSGKPTCRELLRAERDVNREQDEHIPDDIAASVSQDTSPIDSLGQSYMTDVDSLPPTYMSGDPRHLSRGSSLYLRGSLKEPLPQTPSPGSASVCNPCYSGPGEGASRPTSARVNGPPAPRAQKTPQPSMKAEDSRPNPNKLRTTADKRTHEKLIDTLYYHWVTLMRSEPRIETINAIAKILRARHIDDTAYILRMKAFIESHPINDKPDEQLWLKTATEWS